MKLTGVNSETILSEKRFPLFGKRKRWRSSRLFKPNLSRKGRKTTKERRKLVAPGTNCLYINKQLMQLSNYLFKNGNLIFISNYFHTQAC